MEIKYPCKNPCRSVTWYHPGLKGINADSTKLLFILHSPDERVHQSSLFVSEGDYLNVLAKTRTGETLGKLLTFCGLTINDIYLTNALKCVFKSKSAIYSEGYPRCKKVLEEQIEDFEPKKIIGFGAPVRNMLFDDKRKNKGPLVDGIMLDYGEEKIPTLITLHPSSIWALKNEQRIIRIFKKIKKFIED